MSDENEAKRRRAKSIHAQIDSILEGAEETEKGNPSDEHSSEASTSEEHRRVPPRAISPREFIAKRMRESDSEDQDNASQ